MKVVIIGSAYPLRGGIATFVERMAEEFNNQGDEVVIYSYSLQYPNFLFPGKTQYSTEPNQCNIAIKTVINTINPFNWFKVGKQLKAEKADLIVLKFWIPFLSPALGTILRLSKTKMTKISAVLDNVIPHEKRIGDVLLTKYFLNTLDEGIVMSKQVEAELKSLKPYLPYQYLPHPIYDTYKSGINRKEALNALNLDANNQYILFFGFIRKYKGLDILIDAMKEVVKSNSKIKVIVAGEYYDNKTQYENLIEEAGLTNSFHMFTDFIPNDQVHLYFSACDIVALPYRSATQSGISQIAYYFNKPMLVTNVGGLPEIVENDVTGWIVDVDSQIIGKKILSIFENDNLNQFENQIQINKKKYEWKYFVENLKK